jgi:hypothetical protein
VNFGTSFEVKINWLERIAGVRCSTLAAMSVVVDDRPVWPVPGEAVGALEWYADELLSHLAECWKPLVLRQTYPIPVAPGRPSLLRAEAEKRWAESPSDLVAREEERIAAFEDVHNLVNAFGGVYGLPALWILREGHRMVVDVGVGGCWIVPFDAARDAMVRAGDRIAARLQESDHQKWSRLISAWRGRDQGDQAQILAFSTGLDRSVAEELIRDQFLAPPADATDAANDDDELRIAARLAGALPVAQIRAVLEEVRNCHLGAREALDTVVNDASRYIDDENLAFDRAYEQGIRMAAWLRRYIETEPNERVEPFDVLERFGVEVRIVGIVPNTLDAISVWGRRYGPSVVLNRSSRRLIEDENGLNENPPEHGDAKLRHGDAKLRQAGAARATAAHELCHLLLDWDHSQTAVDVLGNRIPSWIEQRARAFAAAFLLPSVAATDTWRELGSPLDRAGLESLLRAKLCPQFGVTMALAAWKLEHGLENVLEPASLSAVVGILNDIAPWR